MAPLLLHHSAIIRGSFVEPHACTARITQEQLERQRVLRRVQGGEVQVGALSYAANARDLTNRAIMQRARQTIVPADRTKLCRIALYRITPTAAMRILVTDQTAPMRILVTDQTAPSTTVSALEGMGIEVRCSSVRMAIRDTMDG